jgi:hypothetical protein
MAKKADFNAEEWSTIVEAPLLAGMRVIAAGRGGTIRESLAIGETYRNARKKHGESELLDEIVARRPLWTRSSCAPPATSSARARRA